MDVSWQQDLASARGVTRWASDVPVADLDAQIQQLGRRTVLLDGSDVEDKWAFLSQCEQAFALPDWFGRNWDGLEECLADLDVGDGLVVLWSDWEMFAEAEPDEYATAVDVFADTARRFAQDDASFVVLLLGEGALDDDEDLDLDLDDDDPGDEEIELDESYDPDPAPPV